MKIKVLAETYLNLGDGKKKYKPSPKVFNIDNDFAIKESLMERYSKFPNNIEIIEEVKEKEIEVDEPKGKRKSK